MISRSLMKIAACLLLACLGACAPKSRFEWGSYETSLYAYYKDTGQRLEYETALKKAIADGRKEGKIAPGLCAELGYMRLEDGDVVQAKQDFEEEMRLFPESKQFLFGVIDRMTTGKSSGKEATS